MPGSWLPPQTSHYGEEEEFPPLVPGAGGEVFSHTLDTAHLLPRPRHAQIFSRQNSLIHGS